MQKREPSEDERRRLQNLYSEKVEEYLDAGHGECMLTKSAAGMLVANALEFFDLERYRLHLYCVMPNHVHVIVEQFPGHDISEVVNSWTSFTANGINRLFKRHGRVWQPEPYDHIIRTEREYRFQMCYVWNNPGSMKNGFVRKRFDQP